MKRLTYVCNYVVYRNPMTHRSEMLGDARAVAKRRLTVLLVGSDHAGARAALDEALWRGRCDMEDVMEVLSRMECLALLRGAMVGRVVFIEGAVPAVLPAPFVVDAESVVFRTSRTSPLAQYPDEVVGFEADDMDGGCEWFVSAVGIANVVSGNDTARSAYLSLPWCEDEDSSCFVRVSLRTIHGRRVPMPNRPREIWPSLTFHTCDRACPPVCAQVGSGGAGDPNSR